MKKLKMLIESFVGESFVGDSFGVIVERITLPSKRAMEFVADDDRDRFRDAGWVESYVIHAIKSEIEDHPKVKSVEVSGHKKFKSFNLHVEVKESDQDRALSLVEGLVEKAIVLLAREFDESFVRDMEIGDLSLD